MGKESKAMLAAHCASFELGLLYFHIQQQNFQEIAFALLLTTIIGLIYCPVSSSWFVILCLIRPSYYIMANFPKFHIRHCF